MIGRFSLRDPSSGAEVSANAGDYWAYKDDYVFRNDAGEPLLLVRDGKVIRRLVRKRDLKDEIRERQKQGARRLGKRTSVGDKFFRLTTDKGESYVVDGVGRILQSSRFFSGEAFSGQWFLYGVVMRYNARPVENWRDVLLNPSKFKKGYVFDVDNSTIRGWGGRRISGLYDDTSALVKARGRG